MSDTGQLRPMADHDLERVLAWRNHPDVRRWMYTTHEIAIDEHRRWFEAASSDSSRHLFVYEHDGSPIGFAHLTQQRAPDVVDWGFYLAPDAPKGSGTGLGTSVLDEAFGALGLHKVCGEALSGNERSIRFHERLGFQPEGVRREQHLAAGGERHSIAAFGLLAREWPAARARLGTRS